MYSCARCTGQSRVVVCYSNRSITCVCTSVDSSVSSRSEFLVTRRCKYALRRGTYLLTVASLPADSAARLYIGKVRHGATGDVIEIHVREL